MFYPRTISLFLTLLFVGTISAQEPKVTFELSQSEGCTPLSIDITDKTTGAKRWYWDLGNGNTSTEQNPSGIYIAGNYTITLIAWNYLGEQIGTVSKKIQVNPKPNLKIEVKTDKQCSRTKAVVSASNKNKTEISQYFWNIGNGYFSNSPELSLYVYETETKTLKLKAIDKNGCEGSTEIKEWIEVNDLYSPEIHVKKNIYACDFPFRVSLHEVSSNDIVKWEWRFHDGTTSSKKNTSHVFDQPGTYPVSVVTTSSNGCVSQYSTVFTIKDARNINPTLSSYYLCKPGKVRGYIAKSGSKYTEWYFGDGSTYKYGGNVVHDYKVAGEYKVVVRSWEGGCFRRYNFLVTVKDDSMPHANVFVDEGHSCDSIQVKLLDKSYDSANYWMVNNTKYQSIKDTLVIGLFGDASILYNYWYGEDKLCNSDSSFFFKSKKPSFTTRAICEGDRCKNFSYRLTSEQTNGANCSIQWFIDDSLVSSNPSFKHTFKERTSYSVRFLAIDSNGCEFQNKFRVTIPKVPTPFHIESDVYYKECPPAVCNFKIIANGEESIKSAWWAFGNGEKSTLFTPQNFYTQPGEYTVVVKAEYSNSCAITQTFKNVIKVGGPTGSVAVSPIIGCTPLETQYRIKSLSNVKHYIIDFGDGNTLYDTIGGVKSYFYTKAGKQYYPALTLVDSKGCSNAIDITPVRTYGKVDIAEILSDSKCSNEPLNAEVVTLQGNQNKTFEWFWDGVLVNQREKLLLDKIEPGKHTIGVKVANSSNCADTLEKEIEIFSIEASLNRLADSVCIAEATKFSQTSVADNPILNHNWFINDSLVYRGNQFRKQFFEPGLKKLKYLVEDVVGCQDSLVLDSAIWVGDTSLSLTDIITVSSPSNLTNELYFQGANPLDFRKYFLWQGDEFPELIDSIDKANVTSRLISADAEDKSFCYRVGVQNICNTPIDPMSIKKHCTVELKTQPDTNLVRLMWNQYVGRKDVEGYTILRAKKNQDYLPIAFVSKEQESYVDSNTHCHIEYSYRVVARFSENNLISRSDTSIENPPFKNDIPLNYPYIVSLSNGGKELDIKYSSNNPDMKSKFDSVFVSIRDNSIFSRVDAKDIKQDSIMSYSVNENEQYFVISFFKNTCGEKSFKTKTCNTIFLTVELNANNTPQLSWSKYNYWPNGEEKYIIQRRLSEGQYETIGETYSDTSYVDRSLLEMCLSRVEYRVVAIPNSGTVVRYKLSYLDSSYSNSATFSPDPLAYIPSAFTPNGNNLNETFRPVVSYYKKVDMEVFNRYGEKLYSHSGCKPTWDGSYLGKQVASGVYMYTVSVLGLDGKSYYYSGTVTLMR